MIDFIENTDWLNREPPYAFKWDHLLLIFLFVGIGVLVGFLLRNKQRKTITIVLVSLWGFYVDLELFYYIYIYVRSAQYPGMFPFDKETMLPLHSCLMFMYIFPFAIFSKNRIIMTAVNNYLVIVNMIMGFITLFVGCPASGCSALSFFGLQTIIYHSIDVIVPLIMLITRYYDLKKNDVYYGLVLFGILALTIWIFDAIAGCDYFYFYDGHTFPVFGFISNNVPAIVWTLIVVSCYVITAFATHYAVLGIKYLVHKKEHDQVLKEENNKI